jgi:hypothetical protein
VVDEGEQCDGDTRECVGEDGCPGSLACRPDCTWGECVTGGFGLLGPPLRVNEGLDFDRVGSVSLSRAASRYGVVYAGDERGPGPGSRPAAYLAVVDPLGTLDGDSVALLPEAAPIGEIDAAWSDELARYGLVMTPLTDVPRSVLVGFADPDGTLLADPVELSAMLEPSALSLAAQRGRWAAAWQCASGRVEIVGMDARGETAWRSVLADDTDVIAAFPGVLPWREGFGAWYHASDPTAGTSWIRFRALDGDGAAVHAPPRLFEDILARPPSEAAFTGEGWMWVASTQPYYDAPVMDLWLHGFDEPCSSGHGRQLESMRVLRASPGDVAVCWSGEQLAVVAAVPQAEVPGARRVMTFARFDAEGRRIGPLLPLSTAFDVTLPDVVWDGSAWAVAHVVVMGDAFADENVELVRVGCIPPD